MPAGGSTCSGGHSYVFLARSSPCPSPRATGQADASEIVIDEVAGYLLTVIATPLAPATLAAGFVLFRLFDITKPPPARWIDRHMKTGLGVVLDDLVAGAYAAVALAVLTGLAAA